MSRAEDRPTPVTSEVSEIVIFALSGVLKCCNRLFFHSGH